MNRFNYALLAALLLGSASCQRQDPNTNAAFNLETTRTEILAQLKDSGARILENTESNVLADLNRPKGRQPMQVSLSFAGGTLKSVQYLPQAQR